MGNRKKKKSRRWSILTPGKTVYSSCFPDFRLSEKEYRIIQNSLLDAFLVLKKICDENGIRYMLSGGSLLGAVRHQGFIPWDDDMDIMMTRKEYVKFAAAFHAVQKQGKLEQYFLAEPFRSEEYFFKITKLYSKLCRYTQVNYMGNPRYNMASIDIFVIEYMPESRVERLARALVFDFAFYASSFCLDWLYPSPLILERCRQEEGLGRFFRGRRALGAIFQKAGGIDFYLRLCRKAAEYPGESSVMGIPCGISYLREVFDASVFTELSSGNFCGYEVSIPRHYDVYLTNLYGNYMEIPPEDRREVHTGFLA